jgi:hypothetical protein
MERPSKRAQFVPGTRAYSADICSHVNAPALCRFAQSYIIGKDFSANESGPPREPPGLRWVVQIAMLPANAAAFSQRDAHAINWHEPSEAIEGP